MWSYWYELRGPAKLWAASVVFLSFGVFFVWKMPGLLPPDPAGRDSGPLAMRVLGGVFIAIGLAVLAPMLATVALTPARKAVWYPRIDLIGGILGALAFAAPAALAFPALLVAYLLRPNVFVPAQESAAGALSAAAAFSLVGTVVLVLLVRFVPRMWRTRTTRLEWTYRRRR